MKFNVQAIGFKADQKLIELIEKKVQKLTHFFDKVINVEVFLKLDNNSSQRKEKIAEVKLSLPGNQLFAAGSSKLFEESVDIAVDNVKRQLKRHKERLRG